MRERDEMREREEKMVVPASFELPGSSSDASAGRRGIASGQGVVMWSQLGSLVLSR